jgi:hypothetical protein
MQEVLAYLKGVYFEQLKIQIHGITLLGGAEHAPHGKILNPIWVGGCPSVYIFNHCYLLYVDGAEANQKHPECRDQRDDLQHTVDTAAKNSQPICQPGTAASVKLPQTTSRLDG